MDGELENRILQLVAKTAMKNVGLDEPLLDSGLVDSISAVDLALEVEAEFGIELPAEKIHEYLYSARTLAEYVAAFHH